MRFLILILMLLITGCTTNYPLDYNNTNPVKIEQATNGLTIDNIIPSNLDGTIAVRSIELDLNNHLDVGVVYMIEDHLITKLIENDYKVLERDPDALVNLYRESSSNYMKSTDESNDNKNQQTTSSDAINVINVNVSDESVDLDDNDEKEQDNKLVNTNLNSADYMLSYRVLECGVIYTELEDKKDNLDQIKRSARTRLHCRLTNTKTSEILSAGIVENEVTDIIQRQDVANLEQISYQYYHHTLPNQGLGGTGLTEDSGYAYIGEKTEYQKSTPTDNLGAQFLKSAIYIVGGLALMIILSP